MVGQPEDGRALVGLVAADALEDARAVVQAVRPDVDRRVGPVDELAVHPDLLGLAHRSPPWAGPVTVLADCGAQRLRGGLDGVHRLCPREADEVGRTRAPPCGSASRRRSTRACATSSFRSTKTRVDVRQRERRDGARRRSPSPSRPGPATRSSPWSRPPPAAIFAASARRSPGIERDDPAAVAVEDERLDDLAELAADRARRVRRGRRSLRELLDPRLDAHLAQERGDALDRLRPGVAHPRPAE